MPAKSLRKIKYQLATLFFLSFMVFAHSYAATFIPSTEPSAEPGRLDSEIRTLPVHVMKPQLVSKKLVKKPLAPAADPSKVAVKFVINKIIIEGNTVLTEQQLSASYAKYLGSEISFHEFEKIAHAITTQYRQAGYIISRAIIPPQVIDERGIGKIQVIEGFIDKVDISGEVPSGIRDKLVAYGSKVLHSKPLQAKVLKRYALLANDLPGVSSKMVLAPSKQTSGAASLTFAVKQKRESLSLIVNNRGNKYIGPVKILADAKINSLFNEAGYTGVRGLVTSMTRELQFVELFHNQTVGSEGTQIGVSANHSHVQLGYTLAPFEIDGSTDAFGVALVHPIIRDDRTSLYFQGNFDFINTQTTSIGEEISHDKLRTLTAGLSFEHIDTLNGESRVNLEVAQGLNILHASKRGQINLSRPNGRPDFTALHMSVERLQDLGRHFSVLVAGKGQWAFNPLLSSAQFGFGGRNYGYAYSSSEITGDNGLAGKAELRLTTRPGDVFMRKVQYYVFYDIGAVWNLDRVTQVRKDSASSLGGGVRMDVMDHVSASFQLASPLTHDTKTFHGRPLRAFFSLVLSS